MCLNICGKKASQQHQWASLLALFQQQHNYLANKNNNRWMWQNSAETFGTSSLFCASSSKLNCYELLEVTPDATQHEIKCAYFRKCKMTHPDTNCHVSSKEAFNELKQAYDTLRRPADRRRYDQSLKQEQGYYEKYGYSTDPNGMGDDDHERWRYRQNGSEAMFHHLSLIFILGFGLVFFFYVSQWIQIRQEQRRIANLIDEDEIATSFMRQRGIREAAQDQDPGEQHRQLARLLRTDIVRRKMETPRIGPNPMEIREKSRWMEAVKTPPSGTNRMKREREQR